LVFFVLFSCQIPYYNAKRSNAHGRALEGAGAAATWEDYVYMALRYFGHSENTPSEWLKDRAPGRMLWAKAVNIMKAKWLQEKRRSMTHADDWHYKAIEYLDWYYKAIDYKAIDGLDEHILAEINKAIELLTEADPGLEHLPDELFSMSRFAVRDALSGIAEFLSEEAKQTAETLRKREQQREEALRKREQQSNSQKETQKPVEKVAATKAKWQMVDGGEWKKDEANGRMEGNGKRSMEANGRMEAGDRWRQKMIEATARRTADR